MISKVINSNLYGYLALTVIAFGPLLGVLIPLKLSGENIFLIGGLFLLLLKVIFFTPRLNHIFIILTISIVGLSILLTVIKYQESLMFQNIIEMKFLFVIALSSLYFYATYDKYKFFNQIFYTCLTVAIVQLLAYILFPQINIDFSTSEPKLIFDGEKQRYGILGGSYPIYIALNGLFLSVFLNKSIKIQFFTLFVCLLLVIESANRFGLLGLSLFMIHFFYISIIKGKDQIFLFVLPLLILALLPFVETQGIIDRVLYSTDESIRLQKLLIGIDLVFSQAKGMFFGYPNSYIANFSINNIVISDNSFIHVLAVGGMITLIFLVLYFVLITRLSTIKFIYLIMFIFSLLITNSILWDYFLLSSIFILMGKDNDFIFSNSSNLQFRSYN